MFTSSDFAPFLFGSGAEKLVDSQVAPIVAAVRGYRSFARTDQANAARQYATPDGKESAVFGVKSIREYLTEDGDLMMMPWYAVQTVSDTAAEKFPSMSVCQMRPRYAKPDSDGKPKKYLFPKNSRQPVSMHPALIRTWTEAAPRVIITEGVIKEDALITGMLISAGATEDDLRLPQLAESEMDNWRTTTGRDRMRELLDRVPESQRLVPLGVAGVNGWSDGNFTQVAMAGREVIIAFDGDTATNPNVHRAFSKLWDLIGNRNGKPRLLDLGCPPALMKIRAIEEFTDIGREDARGKIQMLGVDDYLSRVGSFDELLGFVTDKMPPRPATKGDGWAVGDWRVNADGTSVDECRSGDGGEYWVPRIAIGGRVRSIAIKRVPDPDEVRRGKINESLDAGAESIASVELSWMSDGVRRMCEFSLDVGLLSQPPDRWGKKLSTLPAGLVMHQDWPPRGDLGMKWLAAIKAASQDHIVNRRWEASGWVPGPSEPVFVVGAQVLGKTDEDEESSIPQMHDTIIPSAHRYGVVDTYWDLADPLGVGEPTPEGLSAYKEQVRNDIETVVHGFLQSGVWPKHRHYGAVILAAALRPTIPDRPLATVFFQGPPKTGKSYCASMGMGAWQREPDVWSSQSLPGSATDTKYATELLVAACGALWVIDDLAPSASAVQATQVQQMVEDIVRASFNGNPRAKGGGLEGGLAKQSLPRAQLFVTAENALTTNSARQRTVQLDFVDGVVDHDRSVELFENVIDSLALSRVTAAMIRYWHVPHRTLDGDSDAVAWTDRVAEIPKLRDAMKSVLNEVLGSDFEISGGDSDRQMTMTCDLLLTLRYMQQLYAWADGENDRVHAALMAPNSVEMYRALEDRLNSGYLPSCAAVDLLRMSVDALTHGREQAIGQTLIDCISDAVASGKAHLLNPGTAGVPPFPDTVENLDMNRALGWEKKRGDWEGRGESIGFAGVHEKLGLIAVVNPTNAFQLAQRLYPTRIPFGQKPEASWRAASAEGLVEVGEGQVATRIRLLGNDQGRSRGVVVPIKHFVDNGAEATTPVT